MLFNSPEFIFVAVLRIAGLHTTCPVPAAAVPPGAAGDAPQ